MLKDRLHSYELQVPDSIAFGLDTPEVDDLRRECAEIAKSLPTIDGVGLEIELISLDELADIRFQYLDLDLAAEGVFPVDVDDYIPKKELGEYEYRVRKLRKKLVKERVKEAITEIDDTLSTTVEVDGGLEFVDNTQGWKRLSETTSELVRLVGYDKLRGTKISDLSRHLHFAEPCDLEDIVDADWPNVREVLDKIIHEGEPLAISVGDLGDLVRSNPTGPVTSQLEWDRLDDGTFERLMFNLLCTVDKYENVEWLTHKNAPDRGRDISADFVVVDELIGTKRYHTLVQCKHWTTRSVNINDVTALLEQVKISQKRFSIVIVATTGTFTQDAVEWRDKREQGGEFPAVEFWAGSHLEYLIASRPSLRSAYFSDS